jgi:site-specific recombinase XerD
LGSNSVGGFRQAVVPFLKYLHSEGIHAKDMSECVPNVRKPQPMPSVYSENEIKALLSSIDQSAPSGKRDYAIVVIASHLGLRSSDICALTMESINMNTKTIHVVQQKTGSIMQLALLPEVEAALLKHLESARPASSGKHLFLRRRSPNIPLSAKAIYAIVRFHLDNAGFDSKGRKRGPHSLRMSLATKLLSADVPYVVIQRILGHENPDSTKHYARMDVDLLRRCALEVPPPAGLFAKRLGVGMGVDK